VQDATASITQLLQQWRTGDRSAENELFAIVLPRLHQLARFLMKRERRDHTLQPTELVDEVYLRLVAAQDQDWRSRQHFYAITARVMRRYLIDYARGRPHAKVVALEGLENLVPSDQGQLELAVEIDRLLEELTVAQPEWCTVVELKFFLGLTDEEAADAMGLRLRTMQRMWRDARQWLFERTELQRAGHNPG
jgi:RNA polymerase sigma factor (TIGR02999 family)